MNEDAELKDSDIEPPKTKWLVLVAVIVLAVWLCNWYFLKDIGSTERGTFGDMFGGINALFSGLAFAVFIFTLIQQRAELALQRRELQLTRNEMVGQREQLVNQNNTLLLQRFENTFFQLLRLHNEIVQSIDLDRSGATARVGRDCFVSFSSRLKNELSGVKRIDSPLSIAKIENAYEQFYKQNERNTAHYFRSLYNLLKCVDRSELAQKQKKFYTNLIRSQLSSQELFVLFFNGLSKYGLEKMKPLVEKYMVLKHLNRAAVIEAGGLLHFYSLTALDGFN